MSVQEIVKNEKYVIRVHCGYNGKKRIVYTQTFNGRKKEAEKLEAQLKDKYQGNTLKDNMLFSDLIKEWLQYKVDKVTIKTYEAYKLYSTKYISNGIGHIKIKNVTPIILNTFYKDLKENTHLSEKTQKEIYNIITNIFNLAIKWGYTKDNPNQLIEHIKVHKKDIEFYTPEQVQSLLMALENEKYKKDSYMYARNKALILLAIDSGARRGEITGLTWNDIDMQEQTLNINKITQYAPRLWNIRKRNKEYNK